MPVPVVYPRQHPMVEPGAGSLVRGDGRGVHVPQDAVQVFLLLPALLATVVVLPGALVLEFGGYGALKTPVPAGGTSNYYWSMVQYAPICMTLAFASSMLRAAVVARTVWDKKIEGYDMEVPHDPPPARTRSHSSRRLFNMESAKRVLSRRPSLARRGGGFTAA